MLSSGAGFVAAPVADGAVVPAISDGQTATPTVIGQVPATFAGLSRAGSDGAVRLEEGVIGMLRKLSRKARGVHHGP